MRRWLKRVALGALVVVLAVVLAGGALGVLTVRSSFPQTSGTLTVPGLAGRVEVARDAWGVPQISATTAEDLFFAQGFVHAQDRFWEMDFRRHVTAGRLSELFGVDQVPTDAFIRTLGWRRVAESELALLSDETVRYLEAYAAGVNAYLEGRSGTELSLEYAVLGLQVSGYQPEPWSPADSVAWLKAMAWDLRGNMEDELQRVQLASVLSDAQVADLYPGYPFERHPVIVPDAQFAWPAPAGTGAGVRTEALPAATAREAELAATLGHIHALGRGMPRLFGTGHGIGSNAFAVAGSRTASGRPLLANDPHLAPSMPGIWTQAGLHCRPVSDACPFDVAGFTFSGVPGVVIGHNDRVAWGFTNLGTDVSDLYLEDVQGDRYRRGGRFEPLEVRTETIQVAGGDPVTIAVRSTLHGPLLSDVSSFAADMGRVAPRGEDGPEVAAPDVALAWTALQPGRTADAIFLINAARDFDDFRDAARRFEVPAQNLVYADVDGHIGYQAPGKVPIRGEGDGNWPAPGWDPAYDWQGYVPFEQLPWALDPASGYIVTANNAVVRDSYPVHLTDDWDHGYRAARIVELVEAAGELDAAEMLAIGFDRHGPLADILAEPLRALQPADEAAREALALLDGWDAQQTDDSAAAAVINAAWRHLLARTFHDELAALPADAWPSGGDRWMDVIRALLAEPEAAWWDDVTTLGTAETRDDILAVAVADGVAELQQLLGDDPSGWRWGDLHTLELRNQTFGQSGIGPIEWLFNRGPLHLGGGADVVDATGWTAPNGYVVDWVPSMRMVVDLADLDASRYVTLTGVSGHAFHAHYDDQAQLWARGETISWPFGQAAVDEATSELLVLEPG